jgi:Skp family chaperone for outer membrane proteins
MRRISIGVALVIASAVAVNAEETSVKVPRIGVVDMDRIGAESALGKSYSARIEALQHELEAARTEKQGKLDKIDAELKALQEGLKKQAAFLSEDGAEKKRQEIKSKARERQALVDDGNAEIERMRQKAQNQASALNNELQQKVRPHVDSVARKQRLDLLLDNRSAMVLDSSLDISPAVIAELDQTERVADASAGGAAERPASARPAVAAAAKAPAKR